MTHLLKITV